MRYGFSSGGGAVAPTGIDPVEILRGGLRKAETWSGNIPGTNGWVQRPWGSYSVIQSGDGYQVKLLTVDPGQELSLQLHRHRHEHWVVLAGVGSAVHGEETWHLSVEDELQVPAGMKHRLANPGATPLEILEVQFGDYLGEDDIVRFADRYGRV